MITVATSWDDGLETDKRLLAILERHGVEASFAISPGRHREGLVPNDVRDVDRYGMLVRSSDLSMYCEHDVCNHTLTHLEMRIESVSRWHQDIVEGKAQLEDLYARSVTGIVWPYGVSTPLSRTIAKQNGHDFGRTTPGRPWSPAGYRRWDIVPVSWRTPIESLLGTDHTCIALSGHTYELKTEADWLYLDKLYRTLSGDPNCRLVTLTELAKDIARHESDPCLQL